MLYDTNIQFLIEEKNRVWSMVPDIFHSLMKYHSRKVDYAMMTGLNQLTWTSLNLENFLQKVENAISQFERLTKQVSMRNFPCIFMRVLNV